MTIIPRNSVPGKVCRSCGQWLPLEQFKRNGRSSDKHDHKCRSCRGYRQIKHETRNGVEGKICSICREWKPLGDFSVNHALSDGHASLCLKCGAEKSARYHRADPKRWGARNTASYYRHQEKRLEHAKQWRDENLDAVREYDRARNKERYRRHPEKRRAYQQNRRARMNEVDGEFTPKQWRQLKAYFDHTCLCCGQREPEIKLTVDHVIPIARGGSNYIWNIQPLCLTCNLSKATKSIDYRTKRQR